MTDTENYRPKNLKNIEKLDAYRSLNIYSRARRIWAFVISTTVVTAGLAWIIVAGESFFGIATPLLVPLQILTGVAGKLSFIVFFPFLMALTLGDMATRAGARLRYAIGWIVTGVILGLLLTLAKDGLAQGLTSSTTRMYPTTPELMDKLWTHPGWKEWIVRWESGRIHVIELGYLSIVLSTPVLISFLLYSPGAFARSLPIAYLTCIALFAVTLFYALMFDLFTWDYDSFLGGLIADHLWFEVIAFLFPAGPPSSPIVAAYVSAQLIVTYLIQRPALTRTPVH